jgi:hypothetical protein
MAQTVCAIIKRCLGKSDGATRAPLHLSQWRTNGATALARAASARAGGASARLRLTARRRIRSPEQHHHRPERPPRQAARQAAYRSQIVEDHPDGSSPPRWTRSNSSALPAARPETTPWAMPAVPPVAASGSRDLAKKPRPVPRHVRHMIELMVRGADPDGAPLDFIAAAKVAGIKPDVARRWLDRSEVRRLLRAERTAFREAICAGNEGALKRLRDAAPNSMVQLNAVRTLESLSEADEHAPSRGPTTPAPGLILVVVEQPRPAAPAPPPIDITPATDVRKAVPAPTSDKRSAGMVRRIGGRPTT